MRRPVRGVLEFALYGPDLGLLERFYRDIFGLPLITRAEDRLVALRCGHSTLLLFNPAVTRAKGPIPEHGAEGAGHIAFIAEADELDEWREHLRRHDIAIEREIDWEEGGTSIYLRDPAGNSVELAPPGIWGGLGRALIASLDVRR